MTNYDEDFDDPRQRCKHGTFTGSWWGPDYMCHACEMGDPDPTPNELRAWIARDLAALEDQTLMFEEVAASHPMFMPEIPMFTRQDRMRIKGLRSQLAEALRWAEHDDDDQWLSARHYAHIKEAQLHDSRR